MLVLSRRQQETIVIDGRIKVTIVKTGGRTVRVGIEAPAEVTVHRGEVFQRITADEQDCGRGAGPNAARNAAL